MAKSKRKYPKKSNRTNYRPPSEQTFQTSNEQGLKHNSNVYTEEYRAKKELEATQKPLALRIFVIILACIVFVSFVLLPLLK
jgi:hypothetical protein